MDDNDRLRRQLETGVEFLDGRVVPGLDLAEINPGESRAIESEFSGLTPSRLTTGTTPPITVGNWARPSLSRSALGSGMSLAPKVTVLVWICLMPPPEPIDW